MGESKGESQNFPFLLLLRSELSTHLKRYQQTAEPVGLVVDLDFYQTKN